MEAFLESAKAAYAKNERKLAYMQQYQKELEQEREDLTTEVEQLRAIVKEQQEALEFAHKLDEEGVARFTVLKVAHDSLNDMLVKQREEHRAWTIKAVEQEVVLKKQCEDLREQGKVLRKNYTESKEQEGVFKERYEESLRILAKEREQGQILKEQETLLRKEHEETLEVLSKTREQGRQHEVALGILSQEREQGQVLRHQYEETLEALSNAREQGRILAEQREALKKEHNKALSHILAESNHKQAEHDEQIEQLRAEIEELQAFKIATLSEQNRFHIATAEEEAFDFGPMEMGGNYDDDEEGIGLEEEGEEEGVEKEPDPLPQIEVQAGKKEPKAKLGQGVPSCF